MREEVPSLSYGFEDCALRALYLLGKRKNGVELVRRNYHYPVFVADYEVPLTATAPPMDAARTAPRAS